MRFLVDENLPPAVAEMLRARGHDAVAMRECGLGASDEHLLALAADQRRIVVTRDKGIATQALMGDHVPPGIILFRVPNMPRRELERFAVETISADDDWTGTTSTVTEDRVRRHPLPRSDA